MKHGQIFNPHKLFVGSFIPNALMRYKGISATAKLCWARLAQYAGANGECFPAQKNLAEEIGISEVQVKRVLKELIDDGFILKHCPTGQDRLNHKTNRYYFLWHKCFDANPTEGITSDTSAGIINDTSEGIVDDTSIVRESLVRESKKDIYIHQITNFEKFYSMYPRKVGKQAALRAWLKIKPDPSLVEKILQSLNLHCKSEQWQNRQYIPHPATWLNQHRWEDEVVIQESKWVGEEDKILL